MAKGQPCRAQGWAGRGCLALKVTGTLCWPVPFSRVRRNRRRQPGVRPDVLSLDRAPRWAAAACETPNCCLGSRFSGTGERGWAARQREDLAGPERHDRSTSPINELAPSNGLAPFDLNVEAKESFALAGTSSTDDPLTFTFDVPNSLCATDPSGLMDIKIHQ